MLQQLCEKHRMMDEAFARKEAELPARFEARIRNAESAAERLGRERVSREFDALNAQFEQVAERCSK